MILRKIGLLILSTLLVVACEKEQIDPQQEKEAPSAKDNLPWPLTGYMDTLVRPGDNYYMYCNGTYWDETDLGEYTIKGLMHTEMRETLNQLKANHVNPGFKQLETMLAQKLSNDEFYAFLKPFYDRIDNIQSYEDAFSLAGQLKKEGVKSLFKIRIDPRLEIKMSLQATNPQPLYKYYEPFLTNDHPDYVFANPTSQSAASNNPTGNNELQNRDEEMVIEYLMPSLGYPEEYLTFSLSFDKWLLTPLDELKAFMKMTVFRDYAALANTQGLDYMNSTQQTQAEDAADWIAGQLSELKNYLDGRALIETYITPQLKTEVSNMCQELRQVFIDRIGALDWMSSSTKEHAIKKIERINFYVGCPDVWMADSPDLSGCTNSLEAVQAFYKTEVAFQKAFLGMKRDDDFFNYYFIVSHLSMLRINCNYDPLTNNIAIYAPFMLPPFYEADMHPAMKYGMLMVMIGHELTHSIDASGSKRDENGEYTTWWTIQDKMDYEKLQQQLVELYNRIPVLPDFSPLIFNDGVTTLDENIADLGAVEIAHQAFVNYCKAQGFYDQDLDDMERKFFNAFANCFRSKYEYEYYTLTKDDIHAFDRDRVNGVLMNVDRWYELFDVQWGDYLYLRPENRTHIW